MISGGLVNLSVRDVGRAVRYYVETLGMKLVEQRGSTRAVIDAGDGLRVALVLTGAQESASSVSFFPKIPILEAIAILENRGVEFDVETTELFTRATFRDPDNNCLSLYSER